MLVTTPFGAPEITVTGGGVAINDGDTTVSTGNNTDFGLALVSGGTVALVLGERHIHLAIETDRPPSLATLERLMSDLLSLYAMLSALPESVRSLARLLHTTPAGAPALVPPLLVEIH